MRSLCLVLYAPLTVAFTEHPLAWQKLWQRLSVAAPLQIIILTSVGVCVAQRPAPSRAAAANAICQRCLQVRTRFSLTPRAAVALPPFAAPCGMILDESCHCVAFCKAESSPCVKQRATQRCCAHRRATGRTSARIRPATRRGQRARSSCSIPKCARFEVLRTPKLEVLAGDI